MSIQKGVGQLVPAIDIPILRELPKQGTSVGLKPIGATARYLKAKHPEWELSSTDLSGRFKTLRFLGLAVDIVVLPVGQGAGWQITPKGEALLANHKEEK